MYGLYLTVDQRRWRYADYSSENGLTGTIYTDEAKTVAKDLTGYTLTIRLFRRLSNADHLNKTATITTAASGTWHYYPLQGEMPQSQIYVVKLELSKTGVLESTLNDDQLLTIYPGSSTF